MIAQISPLVEGEHSRMRRLHILGGAVGGAVSGLSLGLAGAGLAAANPTLQPLGAAALLAIAIWAAAVDLGFTSPVRVPSRQTPQVWECALGPSSASFAWGVDLGTGITTRPAFVSVAVLVGAALIVASPFWSMFIMISYGIGKAGAVALAVNAHSARDTCDAIASHHGRITNGAVAAALCMAALLAVGLLS